MREAFRPTLPYGGEITLGSLRKCVSLPTPPPPPPSSKSLFVLAFKRRSYYLAFLPLLHTHTLHTYSTYKLFFSMGENPSKAAPS